MGFEGQKPRFSQAAAKVSFFQSRFTGTCLASDSAFKAGGSGPKTVPEIARGTLKKPAKPWNSPERFHRFFKKFGIKTSFEGLKQLAWIVGIWLEESKPRFSRAYR